MSTDRTLPRIRFSPARPALPWQGLVRQAGYLAWPWVLPITLVLVWWLVTRFELIGSQVLPGPDVVLATAGDLLGNGQLQEQVAVSLQRVLLGYFAGCVVGLGLGVSMGLSERTSDYLYPLVRLVAYVPLLGWLPLLMLWLGIGEGLKIALVAQAALLPVTLNTCNAIRAVPKALVEVAHTYGYSTRQRLLRVILPAAFPAVWSSARYALTKSWLALVVVELLASSEGLGFLMVDSRQLYQMDVMLVAVAAIGLIGFLLDLALALVERRVLRWRRGAFA